MIQGPKGYIAQICEVRLSPKLKTGYRYENQFWNPGFTNEFTQFCRYRYFCFEILFYLILYILPVLSNILNQNLHKK